jgi:hypothetical protein
MIGHWKGTYTGMNRKLEVTTNPDSIPFSLEIESFENGILKVP